jgi:hypothetical protein
MRSLQLTACLVVEVDVPTCGHRCLSTATRRRVAQCGRRRVRVRLLHLGTPACRLRAPSSGTWGPGALQTDPCALVTGCIGAAGVGQLRAAPPRLAWWEGWHQPLPTRATREAPLAAPTSPFARERGAGRTPRRPASPEAACWGTAGRPARRRPQPVAQQQPAAAPLASFTQMLRGRSLPLGASGSARGGGRTHAHPAALAAPDEWWRHRQQRATLWLGASRTAAACRASLMRQIRVDWRLTA